MTITELIQSAMTSKHDIKDNHRDMVRIKVDITDCEPYEPCMQRAINDVKAMGLDPYNHKKLVCKYAKQYHDASRVRLMS